MNEVILKRFEEPDEVVEFEKGKFETVRIGELVIGRGTSSRVGNGLSMLGQVSARRAAICNMLGSCFRALLPPHSMMGQCANFAPASFSTSRRYRTTVGLSVTSLTSLSTLAKPIAMPAPRPNESLSLMKYGPQQHRKNTRAALLRGHLHFVTDEGRPRLQSHGRAHV